MSPVLIQLWALEPLPLAFEEPLSMRTYPPFPPITLPLLAWFLPPETKASSWIDNSRMRKPFLFAGKSQKVPDAKC